MIDEDLIAPARKLAAYGMRALDNGHALSALTRQELGPTDNAGLVVTRHSSEPSSIVDGSALGSPLTGILGLNGSRVGDCGFGDDAPASIVRPGEIIRQSFEVKCGQRRRECIVLLAREGSFLALFALWDAYASLSEHLGPDNSAAAVMALPEDRLIRLARAFVRGNLDRADRTLRLTEAVGSGRAWSELSASAAPLSTFRITEKVAAHA